MKQITNNKYNLRVLTNKINNNKSNIYGIKNPSGSWTVLAYLTNSGFKLSFMPKILKKLKIMIKRECIK